MRWIAILLFFASCGHSERVQNDSRPRVLSTIAMIDDLVKKIGGDEIITDLLVIGELDPHSYELVKGDDEKLDGADVIFSNGLGLEHGASLKYRLEHSDRVVALGDRLLGSEKILVKDGVVDPHIWMDVSLWVEGVPHIVETLSKLLPKQAHLFAQRGEALTKELNLLHDELYSQLQAIPESKRFLVTSHDAFTYFTRAYFSKSGEERCFAPEGLAPEGQMSVSDIRRVVDHLCELAVPVVFPESNVSRDALEKIVSVCKAKGKDIVLAPEPLYGDALGACESYAEMMRHNSLTIARMLQ